MLVENEKIELLEHLLPIFNQIRLL